jgi:triacylglycerol lipase
MYRNLFLAGSALGTVSAGSFDWTNGNITLNHAQNSYCDPNTYLTRTYRGFLEGFVPTYAIVEDKHDTRGYIGYHSEQQTIYVSFRGSESINNWIDNLDAISTDYPLCSNCEVHKGFYKAEQASFPNVLAQVRSLQAEFPSYSVVCTGHSLGGALSTLTAMDLVNSGVEHVKVWNYGCPRVGNTEFANYADSYLPSHHRVTHHKDMVPHTPMHERFTHIDGEWYQPADDLFVQECFGKEDDDCSYQWHITSIPDHLYYLGLNLGASDENCVNFV